MKNIIDFLKREWSLIIAIIAIIASIMLAAMSVRSEELTPLETEVLEQAGADIPVPIPTITIPVVQIPVIITPKVIIPEIIIPQVTVITTITSAQLAMIVDNPAILLNKIVIPSTNIPAVSAYGSVFQYSTADIKGLTLPVTNIPTVVSYGYTQKPLSAPDLITKIILPSIEDAGKGVAENLAKMKDGIAKESVFQKTDHPRNYITDKRTLAYTKDIASSNLIWKAWKQVYSQDYPPMEYVRVPDVTQIKMICEMKATQTQAERDNLLAELAYFKGLGYNTVLAVWEGENTYGLSEQIAIVKAMGFKVFFTYGTRERLEDKIFIEPAKYASGLATLAGQCDGYLVGWRRTSLHLFKADSKFIAYSVNAVRQGNSTIPVFGEIYRGYAGSKNKDGSENMNELCVNIPANASGAFVINFGYQGVRPDGVLKLARASTDVPLIALIVGERPYYMTTYDNHKSKVENRTIIDGIEKRFKKFDFGTATLAGDGSNEIYRKDVSDDLCKSQWSK